jgi:hypothetical protein
MGTHIDPSTCDTGVGQHVTWPPLGQTLNSIKVLRNSKSDVREREREREGEKGERGMSTTQLTASLAPVLRASAGAWQG